MLLARFWFRISLSIKEKTSWWKHEFPPPNVNPQQQNLLEEYVPFQLPYLPPTKTPAAARGWGPAKGGDVWVQRLEEACDCSQTVEGWKNICEIHMVTLMVKKFLFSLFRDALQVSMISA